MFPRRFLNTFFKVFLLKLVSNTEPKMFGTVYSKIFRYPSALVTEGDFNFISCYMVQRRRMNSFFLHLKCYIFQSCYLLDLRA